MNKPARIFRIERLRLETDGSGVRSLVCFSDCPLNCKYCLNKKQMKAGPLQLTPEALRDSLMIDDIYFKASSIGGATFGGGEPALHSEYIEEFRKLCPPEWTIIIETSLNVPAEHVKRLSTVIDHWFIDIKDMNNEIYRKYTGSSNAQVVSNLLYLIEEGLAGRITVRVPLIPGYNTQADVERSLSMLREMGITSIDNLTYFIDNTPDRTTMGIPAEDPPKSRCTSSLQQYWWEFVLVL